MNLVIQICADPEWTSTKQILKIQGDKLHRQPFGEYFEHPIGVYESTFYQSGPTKTRASGACQYAIDTWHPDAVINLGTCGGVSNNIRKLDIIMATKTVQYDVIQRFGKPSLRFKKDLKINLDTSWIDSTNVSEKLYTGKVASADQDLNEECRKVLQKKSVLAADWESASIAKVCELNKVKCLILRGVTDIPERRPRSKDDLQDRDYNKNTPIIMKNLLSVISEMRLR
ncbi:MAG: 5'-methylthioadenosine/S-adenosylhomocysteine nucleosidase [Candidatus Hodarchaeota archaeon]